MPPENERSKDPAWRKWGPYLSERQWGTVREDYSPGGDAWAFTTHDMARSKTWRWGEEGLAGFSDDHQQICFALALWNHRDPFLKERLFGLAGPEGNHGEDVKEIYYYVDAVPSHAYQKFLYRYPQAEFPYDRLVAENRRLTRNDPEFELADTGIFNDGKYFDVIVEYAKASPDDILIRIQATNRGKESALLDILPTIWFRNRWTWGYGHVRPELFQHAGTVVLQHPSLGEYRLESEGIPDILFCENESNDHRLYGSPDDRPYPKDGINDFVTTGAGTVNPDKRGTKAAVHHAVNIAPGETASVRLRFRQTAGPGGQIVNGAGTYPFADFDAVYRQRITEADDFYRSLNPIDTPDEQKNLFRQACAGMLWSKQFYYYNVEKWLRGDPSSQPPPPERFRGRNREWRHLNNSDVISMPDKWEYPWYASWDLAFHCICFARIDPAFAKNQLTILTHEWYMHPNGQLPAYEWSFSDVNPPVHAWAAWRVYEKDRDANGGSGDTVFLETIFHRLLLNFTWWVNRKDEEGNNIFEGGFLGMDNIGLFDRNTVLPDGATLEQCDGTSWMAMYSLFMMRIALELARTNPVYQDMATKFFEHFLYIASALARMGEDRSGLWDEEDQFFYDVIRASDGQLTKLKIRSMVGLVPLFAVEVLEDALMGEQTEFAERLRWVLANRPELADLVSRWGQPGHETKHLLSLLRGHRMKQILKRVLDESEFLSDFGVRSLSRFHRDNPFRMEIRGSAFSIAYTPGESDTDLFGGNSNWRGPVWMPVNYLLIEALERFHDYYGDDFTVEYPTGSGNYLTLQAIAKKLGERLLGLFLPGPGGRRPYESGEAVFHDDPETGHLYAFPEYFHGDTGKGLGAMHQTGWTALIALLVGNGAQ